MTTSVPVPSQASSGAYSSGGGITPLNQFVSFIAARDPTVYDINYGIGKTWINKLNGNYWVLAYFTNIATSGQIEANWVQISAAGGSLVTVDADSGTATASSGVMTFSGTSNEITTAASGSTVTWSVPSTFIAPGSIAATTTLSSVGATTLATTGASVSTFGNVTGTTSVTILGGTGGILLQGAAACPITIGAAAQTALIQVGTSSATNVLDLGIGEGATTVNVGTGTTNAKTISIGTGAAMANTISVGGTGANVITIGDTQTAGSVAIGAAMTTGTIAIGGTGLQTGTITIGGGTGAQTVNLATGATGVKTVHIADSAVANVVTLGSTTGAASTTINAGTGSVSLKSGQIVQYTGTTAATYVALGTDYFIGTDSTSGAITVDLPSSPTLGQSYYIYDATGEAATHNVTVSGNGANISAAGSSASTKILSAAYSSLWVVFNGTIWNGRYSV